MRGPLRSSSLGAGVLRGRGRRGGLVARAAGGFLTRCRRPDNSPAVRRAVAIVLLLSIGALGTGLMERLHESVHRHGRHADDSHCQLDVLLRAPTLSDGPAPALVRAGYFVAFVTLTARPLVSARIPPRLDCRGPPAA